MPLAAYSIAPCRRNMLALHATRGYRETIPTTHGPTAEHSLSRKPRPAPEMHRTPTLHLRATPPRTSSTYQDPQAHGMVYSLLGIRAHRQRRHSAEEPTQCAGAVALRQYIAARRNSLAGHSAARLPSPHTRTAIPNSSTEPPSRHPLTATQPMRPDHLPRNLSSALN